MAKQEGRVATMTWDAVSVGQITDGAPEWTREAFDCTTRDTGDGEESLSGRMKGAISFDGYWDEADSGQQGVETSFKAGTTGTLVFQMDTGSGLNKYTGEFRIESFSTTAPLDGVATIAFAGKFSGVVTFGTQ